MRDKGEADAEWPLSAGAVGKEKDVHDSLQQNLKEGTHYLSHFMSKQNEAQKHLCVCGVGVRWGVGLAC